MAVADTPNDWLTHAERTKFVETGRYDEAIAYCKKLASASPWMNYSRRLGKVRKDVICHY